MFRMYENNEMDDYNEVEGNQKLIPAINNQVCSKLNDP
jgi:hypothetical protein